MTHAHCIFERRYQQIKDSRVSYQSKIDWLRVLKCDIELHYQDEPMNRPQPLYDNLVMLTC